MKKLTTEIFIERAKKIHGDKYDYSKVEYKDANTPVHIICPIHGEFWQRPADHLNGRGCIECAGKKKYTKETFIEKAISIHGDKYDYSKVEYVNNKTKVCIICPIHGEFWQKPDKHLQGHGCTYCASTYKLTTEVFINKANDIHKYKYDYSKVNYVNTETKVPIICPEHGEFWQTPHAHLKGNECPYCTGKKVLTQEDFIKHSELLHRNKYDYSKANYVNTDTKVCIICPEHGEFWQTPHQHLKGNGCPQCSKYKPVTKEEFIKRALIKHKGKYSYELIDEFINTETKVPIICPEHGEFWQTPHNHLNGQGCPYCKSSKLENTMKEMLKENNIKFKQEKTFEWLKNIGYMYLDFYLPECNIAIECQGLQHFIPIEKFGGLEGFLKRQKLDFLKYKLCKEHNIDILYFSKEKYEFFSEIYTDINVIKNKIYEYRSNR